VFYFLNPETDTHRPPTERKRRGVDLVFPLGVHRHPKRPNTVTVRDANGLYVGLINRRGKEWTNYHLETGALLTRVPVGPFSTMEAAFDAFRKALGDV
jgi:hypothetical protein